MRIAFDHQIFDWQKYGGISRYFFELANSIASYPDAEVSIASPLYVNAYLADASNHLHVMGRAMPKIGRAGFIYRAINQLLAPPMMRHYRPDLVHETYYSTKHLAPVGSKVVLTVFDMIHELFPEYVAARDSTSQKKAIAVKRADHIICISEHTRNDLIDLFKVDPAKISVVYLGFSLRKTPRNMVPLNKRPYFLYVGDRKGYKNFASLLKAYATNRALQRDYDLAIFGGGSLSVQERTLIDRLGIHAERIRQFNGDDTILAGLYRQASLFVYPSLYEGFGIPPLEAMSFDCPVVCSNTSSIPEVVGDAAVLFDPRSSDALGDAIKHVLNDITLRQDLIVRGRERIKLFSWKKCAEQTLDVYRRMLL